MFKTYLTSSRTSDFCINLITTNSQSILIDYNEAATSEEESTIPTLQTSEDKKNEMLKNEKPGQWRFPHHFIHSIKMINKIGRRTVP